MLSARRLRLATGLVLFTYVSTHLANHALGLISLGAMDAGRVWFLGFWRNPLGSLVLYASLVTHVTLALWALYRRQHLRMPPWEAAQLGLGLAIPPLLASHMLGTRGAWQMLGVEDTYARLMLIFWSLTPDIGARQSLMLVIAWLHGCIGMQTWLKLRPWYPRAAPWLLGAAVLLPTLALLGFVSGGRAAAEAARDPAMAQRMLWSGHAPLTDATREAIAHSQRVAIGGYLSVLVFVLLARGVRGVIQRRGGLITVTYPTGRRVLVPVGLSVLEVSRLAGIPHASVCGGRGRCSTCRVRVRSTVPPPAASEAEARVLRRLAMPPDVRLACQLRPTSHVAVTPLLPAAATAAAGRVGAGGREQDVTVLFADLRRFTSLAERKLPYDVVFFLNRYFEAVGTAIERAGGVANQYTGDGVMALFGVNGDPEEGCRRALVAAGQMVESVAALSASLADELPDTLRIGLGIHAGPAVVGRMGYGETVYLTAVGDTVHVAARLEQLTKDYDCELVVSEAVARRAGLLTDGLSRHQLALRNRSEPLTILVIRDARQAAAALTR
jgi:adenylate cyclase